MVVRKTSRSMRESGQSPETCRLWGWMHSTCCFPSFLSQLPYWFYPREIRLEYTSRAAPEALQESNKGTSWDSYTIRLWPSQGYTSYYTVHLQCLATELTIGYGHRVKDEALSALPQWWGSHRTSPHQLAKQLHSVLPTVSLGHCPYVSFQLQCKVRV